METSYFWVIAPISWRWIQRHSSMCKQHYYFIFLRHSLKRKILMAIKKCCFHFAIIFAVLFTVKFDADTVANNFFVYFSCLLALNECERDWVIAVQKFVATSRLKDLFTFNKSLCEKLFSEQTGDKKSPMIHHRRLAGEICFHKCDDQMIRSPESSLRFSHSVHLIPDIPPSKVIFLA